MNRRRKTALTAAAGLFAFLTLTAESCDDGTQPSGVSQDKAVADANLDRLNDVQPIPEFNFSQLRQNLIEINSAQADTTQTTSFFFNLGSVDPISSCPSIGFPIPSTMQLTNPDQAVGDIGTNGSGAVIAQSEQTGVYTGDSTGTYVICVDATGDAYAFYWEGYVAAVTGPAEWDATVKQVKLIGPPSFEFSTTK